MSRISGINVPKNKRILISLTYIYGIGKNIANIILKKSNINNIKTEKLSINEIKNINKLIDDLYLVEGDLKSKVSLDIKTLVDIKCYRGIRHLKKLPTRGQRTSTNARTRKGKKITVAGKKAIK